jgi:cytochrome c
VLNRRKPHILASGLAAFAFLVLGSTLSIAGRAQTTGSGKELFEKRCGGCHALDRDKEGPRLRGVYGRVAGSLDSFKHSDALKNSKITWTDERLDKWLTDTEKLVPDNDMTFHVEKPEERGEIIAFLKQNSGK